MRVACTGFPITPWADSCKSGFVLPWDSVLWHWCMKSLSSFPFVNARHQRKGNESPRDATDTRNHPSFVRHKHHLSFESYAGAQPQTILILRHKDYLVSIFMNLPVGMDRQYSLEHLLQELNVFRMQISVSRTIANFVVRFTCCTVKVVPKGALEIPCSTPVSVRF